MTHLLRQPGRFDASLQLLGPLSRLAVLFDDPEVRVFPTTDSTSLATCPGATAKRFPRERTSRHSRPDSRSRSMQSARQHSHRNPATGWPLSIHFALRSLRWRHHDSL